MRSLIRIAIAMLMLASAVALAQVSKGSISGTVVDPSGAAVVEAEVRVTALDTNQVSSSVTGGTGVSSYLCCR